MRILPALILSLLVVLPLGLLAWLGVRVASAEQERLSRTFDDLLRSKLEETDNLAMQLLDDRRRDLMQAIEDSDLSRKSLDALSRSKPGIIRFFHQAPDGTVLFPSLEAGLTFDERAFLDRFGGVFDGKLLLIPTDESKAGNPGTITRKLSIQETAKQAILYQRNKQQQQDPVEVSSGFGWFPWYSGNDVQLLFWMRGSDGSIAGAEISRVRLLADLIGLIPDPGPRDLVLLEGCVTLSDSAGRTLFRWGGFHPPAGNPARIRIPLSGPLHSWSLHFHASSELADSALGSGTAFPLAAGLLAVGLALSVLAIFLYRENMRELRDAAQKVSFVNQVSHELKTPLTNIRLHAELLSESLDEEDESQRNRIGVIISESQRLGRLINNVLAFSRQQRDRISLRPSPAVPDILVGAVIEHFRPFLESRGIRLETSLEARREVNIDADVLEQILNNLLSNVEKYAAAGGIAFVATRQSSDRTFLLVRDAGPGIPLNQSEFVFQPFARLNDSLTEGVAGAGIGLTLARGLARKHGGDLELVHSVDRLSAVPDSSSLFWADGAFFLATLLTTVTEDKR